MLLLLVACLVQDATSLKIGEGEVQVVLPARDLALPREKVLDWVRGCGAAVAEYYGRFPVAEVRIEISARRGGGVRSGRTWNGRLIRIQLGTTTTEQDLGDDWMLTHEMCHLAFPDLDEKHAWMYEGLATWVEPIARVRAGRLTPDSLWMQTLDGMPKGLPGPKDGKLDGTTAWGRTYWGGAYYWMRADLEIRERTKDQKSLQTALRAILAAGGDGAHRWTVDDVIDTGDQATGTTVLRDLYREMGQGVHRPDLPALWKRLGVERKGGAVVFDDAAPQADLRRALTSK